MFKECNIIVFGAGISGIGAVKTLVEKNVQITLYDENKIDLKKEDEDYFLKNGVSFKIGKIEPAFLADFDLLVLSPGISINSESIQNALSKNVEVIGEVELAARLCKGQIIAVTGTNGKTTTTTLLYEMLKTLPSKACVGGNIGQSLSVTATEINHLEDVLLAEISSFQLESIDMFRPHIAAILNITPDHLDRHGSFEGYVKAKMRICVNQTTDDYLVLNYNDETLQEIAKASKARVCFFSSKEKLSEGAFVNNDNIAIAWKHKQYEVCPISDMKIFGQHNVENALAACMCAFFAGVSIENMQKVLKTFEGVEHRIEFVKTINGVNYYNDSKATNPESSIKALESFSGNVILIAGGYDKMTDLTEFMNLAKEKTDHLILLGNAKERFASEAKKACVQNIHIVNSFDEAVNLAYSLAKEPQVVLFSPACSSYDMFNNFEERGRYFKQLVNDFK